MPLESSIIFSIKDELKSRWGASHIPNIRVPGWPRLLLDMRAFWRVGTETILETSFYEPVRKPDVSEKGGLTVVCFGAIGDNKLERLTYNFIIQKRGGRNAFQIRPRHCEYRI